MIFLSYPGFFVMKEEDIEFFTFGGDDPNSKDAAEALLALRRGEMVRSLERVLEARGERNIMLGSELLAPIIREHYGTVNFQVLKDWEALQEQRSRIAKKLEQVFGDRRSYTRFANEVSREIARDRVSRAGEKKDLIISETVTIVEELTKMANNLTSHLRDFYGYYFPELSDIVHDNETYLKLITIGRKADMTEQKLENITGDTKLTRKIFREKEISLKARFKDETIHMLQEIARKALALSNLRSFLLSQLEAMMLDAAPNITALVDSNLGAKLIKEIGGLEKMAKSPSSTIQVIGAEKALFRALRGEGSPPKHGILFQDPRVHSAPNDIRGNIARTIANKLAIAARVDYFSNKEIGERLSKELTKRIEEIKEER